MEALDDRRRREGLTNAAFARRLGVSEATYSRARRGLMPVGRLLTAGALRLYPELAVVLAIDAREPVAQAV